MNIQPLNLTIDKIEKIKDHFYQKNVEITDIEILTNQKYQEWKEKNQVIDSKNCKFVSAYLRKNLKNQTLKGDEAIKGFKTSSRALLNFFAVANDQCVLSFKILNAKRFTYDDAVWLSIHVFPEVMLYNPQLNRSFIYNQDGYHFYF
jgi:hypothetical protein